MPELPEVEVTRRACAAQIAGARIESVALGKPLRWPLGIAPELLAGRDVHGVRRRGKYLLMELSEGLLMLHLGMSGSLRFVAPHEAPLGPAGTHDHFDLQTSKGLLRLHDPRRFGAVMYVAAESDPWARRLLDNLGMEPLDDSFSFETFRAGLKASRTPIKQLLLNGSVVVGVGNIYASEVLFMARIAPTQPACECWPWRWSRAARRCAISPRPTAWLATSSCRPRSMAAKACPARIAARPCKCCARGSAAPTSARGARRRDDRFKKRSEFSTSRNACCGCIAGGPAKHLQKTPVSLNFRHQPLKIDGEILFHL